jgi:hypothetical protein
MKGGLFMNKNEQVAFQILEDFRSGIKTRKQAALLLGVTERAVTRRARKLRLRGLSGIKHGNYHRKPSNKFSDEIKIKALELIKSSYFDFNIHHAHELLIQQHGFSMSYMTLLGWCKSAGIGNKKRRRPSKARIYRERMSNEGILLQMDGSHHKWNGKDVWCLISVIDDATSNIPVGQFYDGETSWNCMHLLRLLFETRGIPQFLYTDQAGWAGGGSSKRHNFSQVVRACEELGIKIIRANSPQAKGRIERSYKTLQDRLIPEMRLKRITSMTDANRYLQQAYWHEWNRRFSVEPQEQISRYTPLKEGVNLDNILCMKFERLVNADHTFSYENKRYKLDPGHFRTLRKKTITIHEYKDINFKVFYAGQEITFTEVKLPQRRWA